MRKLGFIVFLISFLSCNDGNVIVTSFDFDAVQLQFCEGSGGYLFFKINDGGTESLSVRLGITDEQLTGSATLVNVLDGSTNFANYRIFSGAVNNNYFCNEIPPTAPEVSIEYIASSGTATLTVVTALDDDDGLPFVDSEDPELEGMGDLDGDEIPNFYDFDDDGDNVPTSLELDTENADGDNDPLTNPLDTDSDGIPDYLDDDDDGDGVLTRYEAEGTLDPTQIETDPGVPDYLNPFVSIEVVIDSFREHDYDFVSDIDLVLSNLVLVNGEEQITRETLEMDGIESILSGNTTVTPSFPDN